MVLLKCKKIELKNVYSINKSSVLFDSVGVEDRFD